MILGKIEKTLLFLIILFLPTQLGKHFWPDFSYIYSLKIDYLSPTVYFWDLLVLGLFVVWFIKKPQLNKFALNLFLIFFFSQALSLTNAQNIGAGLVRLEQYLVVGLFGLYLSSQNFNDLIKKIKLPLALAILGEATIAILQVFFGSTLGLWILGERSFNITTPGIAKFDFYGIEVLRPYATFPHPNVLAGFTLLVIAILSFWGAKGSQTSPKRLQNLHIGARMTLVLASILAGLAIFLSMSRTAILAGVVTVFILLKRKLIIIIIIIIFILSPVLFTRFSSLFNFDNLTLIRRTELMGDSWKLFQKFPLTGTGLNNFIPAMAANLVSGPSRFLQPVHNIFLLSLAETGIVGLMGFMILIGWPIRFMVYRLWFIDKTKSATAMYDTRYTIIPWFIIIFLGLFDHYFLTLPQGYRLLFLIWGLSFSRF